MKTFANERQSFWYISVVPMKNAQRRQQQKVEKKSQKEIKKFGANTKIYNKFPTTIIWSLCKIGHFRPRDAKLTKVLFLDFKCFSTSSSLLFLSSPWCFGFLVAVSFTMKLERYQWPKKASFLSPKWLSLTSTPVIIWWHCWTVYFSSFTLNLITRHSYVMQ